MTGRRAKSGRTIFDEAVHRFARSCDLGDLDLAELYAALAFKTYAELTLRRIEFELWGWSGQPSLSEIESLR